MVYSFGTQACLMVMLNVFVLKSQRVNKHPTVALRPLNGHSCMISS